jgi:hypothetical protein
MMFLIAAGSPFVQAQETSAFETSTLQGISTVFVLVESLPDGAKVLGLSGDTIQTDVELKLRLAGMRVVTEEEGVKLPGGPYLYVRITLTDNAVAASIEVELVQSALLQRNNLFAPSVTTWDKLHVLSYPTSQGIRDAVKDDVDKFLNDWLSVNPKK